MSETLPRRPSATLASVIAAIVFVGVYAAALSLLFAPGDLFRNRTSDITTEVAH